MPARWLMLVRNLPSTAFHSPFKSGLPSGRRGAGAVRFGLPSAVRGIRGSKCFSHCAGADEAESARRTHASAAYLLIAAPQNEGRADYMPPAARVILRQIGRAHV